MGCLDIRRWLGETSLCGQRSRSGGGFVFAAPCGCALRLRLAGWMGFGSALTVVICFYVDPIGPLVDFVVPEADAATAA